MGRGPGSATTVLVVAVPARGMAGSSSSTMSAHTAPGRVLALSWGLSATSLFVPLLSTQGCEVVVTTAGIALLILSQALGMGMGVS